MQNSPSEYRFHYSHRVRYAEVDPQGIVFNSRYLEYCDAAVTEYLRAVGFPPQEFVASTTAIWWSCARRSNTSRPRGSTT